MEAIGTVLLVLGVIVGSLGLTLVPALIWTLAGAPPHINGKPVVYYSIRALAIGFVLMVIGGALSGQ